ncbi:excinuclease ABC subunit C, partial [Listeria monocytogenes]|nr:excinuclease ABC subunit C [Listeria monocytogenes]
MDDKLQKKLTLLPESPGCYIYRDENNEILYIGKSKCLKNRVKSYFHSKQ